MAKVTPTQFGDCGGILCKIALKSAKIYIKTGFLSFEKASDSVIRWFESSYPSQFRAIFSVFRLKIAFFAVLFPLLTSKLWGKLWGKCGVVLCILIITDSQFFEPLESSIHWSSLYSLCQRRNSLRLYRKNVLPRA